jgi:hypothetical protein
MQNKIYLFLCFGGSHPLLVILSRNKNTFHLLHAECILYSNAQNQSPSFESRDSDASSSGVGDEGEQRVASTLFRLVEEQVVGDVERAVRADDGGAEGERGEDERADGGEEDDEGGGGDEPPEHLLVGEGAPERGQGWRVGGAEEVEEAPGGEEGKERGEGEGVGEERGGEGERDDGGVVDAEVGQVLPQAGGGLGEGLRLGESGPVHQLRPGPRAGERQLGGLEEADEEGAGGGGGGGRGVVGGDGGGYG